MTAVGLLGLSNFHLPPQRAKLSLRRGDNTHWILAKIVSNTIAAMWDFFFFYFVVIANSELMKVICSSATRYARACMLVWMHVWLQLTVYVVPQTTAGDRGKGKTGETKRLVLCSSESI